jgi:two-component sensor histidine kinase
MAPQDDEIRLETENVDLRRLLAIAGIAAAEHDVAQNLQRLVLEELHHRIKNTLATVQAIASQSLRSAQTVEEGRRAIESRLLALSRVHDLLLETNWSQTMLEAVLKTAIEPFETPASQQFSVQVPIIKLTPKAVLPIAMVINELCTNAVKYGALSDPQGRVDIRASIDDKVFRLNWTERDGPIVQDPTRRSFGSRLVEHAFAGHLQGTARLKFPASGVTYQLEAPVAALGPVDQ